MAAATSSAVVLGLVVQGAAAAPVSTGEGGSDRSGPVPPGAVASLVLTATRSTAPVGAAVGYTVGALDGAARDLGNVTALVQLSISPEGSCVNATCTAGRAGAHTVTATFVRGSRSIKAVTVLQVVAPAAVASPAARPLAPRPPEAPPERRTAQPAPRPPKTERGKGVASPPPVAPRANPAAPTPPRPAARPSGVARLVLSPARTFTAPGHGVRYTAVAYDAGGRSIGDVTSRTAFSMTFSAAPASATGAAAQPVGGCAGAMCTPARLGRHTVTGTLDLGGSTVKGTAALQVVPRHRWPGLAPRLASIEISPRAVVTESGVGVTYAATGYDAEHRALGDVTALTTFSISPGGTCVGSTCTATTTQTTLHTVTATVRFTKREVTATATQLVTPRLAALEIRPRDVLTEVGRELAYTAYGLDGSGRRVADLTGHTVFSMGAAGRCTGSRCTSAETGRHGVTGRVEVGGRVLSDTAPVRVIPRIAGVAISPASATARVGESVTYAVRGVDEEGEPVVDLTADAVVSISAPGTCAGATCTVTTVGDHTVRAGVTLADRTESDTTTLRVVPVVPGAPVVVALRLSSSTGSIAAGESVTYVATGLDEQGRPVADLTADTAFSISSPGTCDGPTCTATRAQTYTVSGSVQLAGGPLRASTSLEVLPGPVDRLFLDPSRATATAGASTAFAAFGVDAHGNRVDRLPDSTTLRITAPGTCTGFTCTATRAQDYTVSVTVETAGRELRQTATLEVLPGPVESLRLDPARATATAGEDASFRAHGVDAYGNRVGELTDRSTFTITAPGSCVGATCRAQAAQTYTITGTVDVGRRVGGTATLVVSPGPLETLVLGPPTAVVTGSGSAPYRAHGADAYGNRLGDVTDRTTITIAPAGSCRSATCTASRLGRHTVTGTADLGDGPVTATAQLLVLATPVVALRMNPRSATIHPDGKANFTATGLDATGRIVVDLTDYTTFSVDAQGPCRLAMCTARGLGTHRVTGSVVMGGRTIGGGSTLIVAARPSVPNGPGAVDGDVSQIRGIELSPEAAEVDAGAPLSYVADGLDADGKRLREVTGEATFTIGPDGSCSRSACIAPTPGPHTVTATIGGPGGGVTGSVPGTVTVDRAAYVRTPTALRARAVVTGSASLSVTRAPPSCLISPNDVRSLTTTTQDAEAGTSVRVDGALDPRLATCQVRVLLDGVQLDDDTAVGADGRVSAAAVVPFEADRSGVAEIVTIDGRSLATARYRIVAPSDPRSLLWLLVVAALLVAAAAIIRARARRQRRWVQQHVQLKPVVVPARISTLRDPDSPPSFTVRLRPKGDPGTVAVTEEGHR